MLCLIKCMHDHKDSSGVRLFSFYVDILADGISLFPFQSFRYYIWVIKMAVVMHSNLQFPNNMNVKLFTEFIEILIVMNAKMKKKCQR